VERDALDPPEEAFGRSSPWWFGPQQQRLWLHRPKGSFAVFVVDKVLKLWHKRRKEGSDYAGKN
jgi:hypothetical protein